MKKLLVVLLCLGLTGCATITSMSQVTAPNRENLLKLSVGMDKAKVIEIMGNKAFDMKVRQYVGVLGRAANTNLTITNPYRSEILQGKDRTLEVVYYVTDDKNNDGTINDNELTPLVFDDGKLIGWGWSFLQENINKYGINIT